VGTNTVDLVEYSDEWPPLFRSAARVLAAVLGDQALAVERIGSTSVSGLIAKPTIDIAVGVRTIGDVYPCRETLEMLGYDFRSGFHDDHLLARKIVGDERAQHVHFRVWPSEEFDDWVFFRDLLRRDDDARRSYAEEKRALAERFYNNRCSYTEAKTEVVERLVARAREGTAAGADTDLVRA
jgi:GrpB-like predicted nucleotidyltransferase (UPF0157 family)